MRVNELRRSSGIKVGDVLTIVTGKEYSVVKETIKAKVIGMYPRYVLLNNGYFNFCADYIELKNQSVVIV